MNNYLKNKNFIPKSYVNKSEKIKNKGNTRGLIYLVIINLILLPITIEIIFKKDKVIEEEIVEIVEIVTEIESIITWLDEYDKNVKEINIKDNKGSITTTSVEKIYYLEEKDNISINNIIQNEKGDYILEIERNNNYEK